MKKLVIYPLLLCIAFSAQAQKIVQLEEARINVSPIELFPTSNPDEYKYVVNENYTGEFTEDPIQFIEENFNIHDFIGSVKDKNYDSYSVSFSNEQGYIRANYDKNGKLVKTSQKFKNILIPPDMRYYLHKNHNGWTMIKNSYSASGRGNLVEKELYRIKLKKDKKSQVLKIDPKRIENYLSSIN